MCSARRPFSAACAAAIAAIGWTALAVDFAELLPRVVALGGTVLDALVIYLRFFTILTNTGVAALMTATAVALGRGRAPPRATMFRAAVVYMAVTSLTYELLLRRLWSPQGVQFATDLAFHDVQPALTLAFWLVAAPKALGWRDLPWLFVYPALYFAATLVAGAAGAGYPYDFLDAGRLGYPAVVAIGLAFLGAFYALGALATAAARLMGGRSAAGARRPLSGTPTPAAPASTRRR